MTWHKLLASGTCLLVLACGSGKATDEGAGSSNDTAESGETDADDLATSSDDAVDSSSDDDDDTDTSDDDTGFVPQNDALACSLETSLCDEWSQDCPEGEKCTPIDYSDECGATVSCRPVVGENAADESCTVVDLQDDCDADSWCYAQMLGLEAPSVCVAFCQGSPDQPSCANPDYVCIDDKVNFYGALGCRPRCNPLTPDENPCLEGERCSLASGSQGDFGCVLINDDLAPGEPCSNHQECDGGLCLEDVDLSECADDRCCASYCDLLAPDCPVGNECVAVEPVGNPESTVGVCALPA